MFKAVDTIHALPRLEEVSKSYWDDKLGRSNGQ